MEDEVRALSLASSLPPDRYSRLSGGLPALVQAANDAMEAASDVWQYALCFQGLLANGLREDDLRWLLTCGFLEHADEQGESQTGKRDFHRVSNLSINVQTCFVLTEEGHKFVQFLINPNQVDFNPPQHKETKNRIPSWDAMVRKLYWQGRVVKHFQTPAPNQEQILTQFETMNWVNRIENPLSEDHDEISRLQLRETIRRLNGNQQNARIRFSGDGTGQGVCWHGC